MSVSFPTYECRKTVHAFRIKKINLDTKKGFILLPDHPTLSALWVSDMWVQANHPEAGGYYVVDTGGRASYEPAPSFDAAHLMIADAPPPPPLRNHGDEIEVLQREVAALRAQLTPR